MELKLGSHNASCVEVVQSMSVFNESHPNAMLLARLPEAIVCGLVPPGEDTQPILFSFNPFSIVPLTRCPPQRALHIQAMVQKLSASQHSVC